MTKEELLTEPVMVVFHKTKEGIFNAALARNPTGL